MRLRVRADAPDPLGARAVRRPELGLLVGRAEHAVIHADEPHAWHSQDLQPLVEEPEVAQEG
eukprot:13828600-Alexandrium_andersonii.AAC.1